MNPDKYEAHDSLSSGGIEVDDMKNMFSMLLPLVHQLPELHWFKGIYLMLQSN
jgi:hypothetical protein